MPDPVRIETSSGDLKVTKTLVAIWNRYGWPSEILLRRMAGAGPNEGESLMGDKEWFTVEGPDGQLVSDADGPEFANKERAQSVASAWTEETSGPLLLVKHTRREIKRFRRVITVSSEDLPAGP